MTAADALTIQPAARPEPSAAKAAAHESNGADRSDKSFAAVLSSETNEKAETGDTAEKPTELSAAEEISTDATVIAQPAQPAPPQVIPPHAPATASPAVILAGLDPNAVAAEGTSRTSATDGVKSVTVPEIAIDRPAPAALPTPAPTAAKSEVIPATSTEVGPVASANQEVATQQVATLTPPVGATPAKPAAKKETKAETAGSAIETLQAVSLDTAVETVAFSPAATQPGIAATAMAAPTVAPEQPVQSTSSPGEERAAAPAVETMPSSTAKTATPSTKTAAASAGMNVQASTNKAAQAEVKATGAAAELKTDATTSSATSISTTEVLASSRTSGVEPSKLAQSSQAAQATPAATIQVYSRMIERFDGRAQRFEVRLDPAELGRVDVRIEVGADKKVHAVLAAHDSAALSDLMRGQRALETSLRQAGIDVADGGIKFELSSDAGRNPSNDADRGNTNANASGSGNVWRNFKTMDVAVDANAAAAARPWRSSRLDLVA